MHDLKFACRQLLKHPGFTLVAVVTLALGIGANAMVFSWIRAALLDAIPGAVEPDRLVVVAPRHATAGVGDTMSLADLETLSLVPDIFSGMAGSQIDVLPVRIDRDIEWVWGQPVQATFFEVLGVRPVLGRTFERGEDLPGAAESVAVISHRLWQQRFGGARDVVGRRVAESFPNSNRDTTFAVLPLWKSPGGGQEVFLPLLEVLGTVAVRVALAATGKGLLLRLMPPSYLPISYDFRIDGLTLAATCAITLFTGLLFGLVPAWRATRR